MKTQRESDEVARLDGVGSAGAGARAWSPARTRWRRAMRGCFLSLTGTEREAWPRCLAISGGADVSNDNPFSESQFKPLKYRPAFPSRFGGPKDARGVCAGFFGWLQHRAPPFRARLAHPRRHALRPGPPVDGSRPTRAGRRLHPTPGTLCGQDASSAFTVRSRVDHPAQTRRRKGDQDVIAQPEACYHNPAGANRGRLGGEQPANG